MTGANEPDVVGTPRLHLRSTDSTNERAIVLALQGAPHGTLVTAGEQTAGRGRQGRHWTAPAGRALLGSIIVREPPELVPLIAAVAVAEAIEETLASNADDSAPAADHPAASSTRKTAIKWPNDIHLAGLKVAGILVEGRPQEGWAVVGIGVNVALRPQDFPAELRDRAGTLGLGPDAIEPLLERLLAALTRWLGAPADVLLDAWRARDALLGQQVKWEGGRGLATGIDGDGRLVIDLDPGPGRVALEAGEVHLAG